MQVISGPHNSDDNPKFRRQLMSMSDSMRASIVRQCRRCGTCCRNGGPALHLEDQALVESGKIALTCLYTIRQGEPVYDNVAGSLETADTDIIRIRGCADEDRTCLFFDSTRNQCGIYDRRPLECRILECWNPQRLTAAYSRDRLTRRHLLEGVPGVWDLVSEHHERCDYGRIATFARSIREHRDADGAGAAVLECVRYDHSLRQVTLERTRYDEQMLLFLFGRPLAVTLRLFRLRIVQKMDGPVVEHFM